MKDPENKEEIAEKEPKKDELKPEPEGKGKGKTLRLEKREVGRPKALEQDSSGASIPGPTAQYCRLYRERNQNAELKDNLEAAVRRYTKYKTRSDEKATKVLDQQV